MIVFLSFCPLFLSGCATPFAHRVNPPSVLDTRESFYLENVPPVAQEDYQCGPAALESVIRYWGGEADADDIGKVLYKKGTGGVFNFSLAQHAKSAGFWSEIREEENEDALKRWLRLGIPPVVMLDTGTLWVRTYHFVVLRGFDDRMNIFYANTGQPETQAIDYEEFARRWKKADSWSLIVSPPEKVDWELDEAQSVEIGLILEKNGDLDGAERRTASALSQNPKNPAAKFNLANLYGKTGRFPQAEGLYRELLKEDPDRPEVSNNLAWAYYEAGRYEEARQVVETAFQNGARRNYDILDTAGMIYCKMGLAEEAQKAFLEAKSRVPTGDAAALDLIQAHMKECAQPQT